MMVVVEGRATPADASPSAIAVSDGAVDIADLRAQRLPDVPRQPLTGNDTDPTTW